MAEEGENEKTGRAFRTWRVLRGWAIALCCVVGILWAAWLALPFVLPFVSFPEVELDLSPNMENVPPELFPDKTLKVRYDIARRSGGGFRVMAKGQLLGWPFTVSADVELSLHFFSLGAKGTAEFRLDGSRLGATATFAASLPGEWSADVEMAERTLGNDDPFIAALIARHPQKDLRTLVFDTLVSLTAHAEQTKTLPVPKWEAKCSISELHAGMEANGKPVKVANLRIRVGASGVADHVDIAPMFPRADTIEAAGCVLSNAFASVRATETAFLVTEAGAGFCGGDIRLYALFLDPKNLNAGVTLYLDGIDAGQALEHINGFRGRATGALNGKLPLRLVDGREIRLKKGYLYSVPGEIGKIELYDPEPFTDYLALTGVPDETRANMADALADLDYSVLRIGLAPETEDTMALSIKLEGSATRGNVTVPVSFTVTFHGQIEQIINTGLKAANRKEQKR